MARLEIKGAAELQAALFQLGSESFARRANRRSVNTATTPILAAARANAPVESGALKRAMAKKVTGRRFNVNGIVGADVDYVGPDGRKPSNYDHLVEFGHVSPEGQEVPAHPFLRPAWDETVGTAQEKYASTLADSIEREAARQAAAE